MPTIRIILIEDNPEFRQALSTAIEHIDELKLVAKFGTAEKALRRIQENPGIADVLLLDLNLPKLSGLEALDWVKEYAPEIKVIVLTQSDDRDDVLTAIQKKASGYLLKSAKISQIKDAVMSAMEGDTTIDSHVTAHLMESIMKTRVNKPKENILSEREMEVLKLLGQGMIKKEIATELDISSHTVTSHVRNIYEKMGVLNAPAAITKAYELGILRLK